MYHYEAAARSGQRAIRVAGSDSSKSLPVKRGRSDVKETVCKLGSHLGRLSQEYSLQSPVKSQRELAQRSPQPERQSRLTSGQDTSSEEHISADDPEFLYRLMHLDPKSVEQNGVPFFAKVPNNLPASVYLTLAEPGSSQLARYISMLVMVLITVSCTVFCLESLETYRVQLEQKKSPPAAFAWVEVVCVVAFTIEYVGKLCTVSSVPSPEELNDTAAYSSPVAPAYATRKLVFNVYDSLIIARSWKELSSHSMEGFTSTDNSKCCAVAGIATRRRA